MSPGIRSALVILSAGILSSGAIRAEQELRRPEEQLAAIYSLRVQLEIEQRALDGALQRNGELVRQRVEARERVARLYRDLDAMVDGRVGATPEEILEREQDVARAEKGLETIVDEARSVRRGMRETHDRIEILQERIAGLRETLPSDSESLTGNWGVSYLPSGDTGIFTLRQTGTLLVGEYVLEGGWKGSLQGTFVDGKLLLHRIDSKLGRSSDLEGSLSPDGQSIQGHWTNFILSGGQPANGSWVARKQHDDAGP